jgi:hypothetical protein
MKSAINKAWEHGGPDFQSRFDKSTAQIERLAKEYGKLKEPWGVRVTLKPGAGLLITYIRALLEPNSHHLYPSGRCRLLAQHTRVFVRFRVEQAFALTQLMKLDDTVDSY